jgi:hypothetical protein
MKRSVRVTFLVLIAAMLAAVVALRARNASREAQLAAPSSPPAEKVATP